MQKQPPQSNPTAPGTLAKTVQASRASGGDLGNTPLSTAEYPGWGHYFGGIRVHAAAPKAVQAKLSINQPEDEYEQEANRVANQLTGAGMATTRWHGGRRSQRGILDRAAGRSVGVQAKTPRQATRGPEVNPHLEERLNRSGPGGSPLPDEVRRFFEPRMGFDFGQVRIHKDNEAARMNRQLGARAFTYGRDIYFGAGQYNPRLAEGKRLIAHELTHVAQQGGDQRSPTSQPPGGGLVQRVPAAAAAPALGAAEWIALGTAGFEITQNAVNQTAGDIT